MIQHKDSKKLKEPLLIAHKGDTSNYPENTIPAFASAFKKGADGIELDVHLNNKNEVIVVHPYLHDSTQTYPLLAEVLDSFANFGRIEIEIKSLNRECVNQVRRLIDKYEPVDIELTSSIQPLLPIIRKTFPEAKIGLIFNPCLIEEWMTADFIIEWLIGRLKLTRASVLHLASDMYTRELVQALKEAGYITHLHIRAANRKTWEKVTDLKLDQCSFDDITVLEYKYTRVKAEV